MGLIRSRKEKGQGLVELAILLPLLLIILLGIIDFGRVFYAYVTITNASREGARYGSRYPTRIDGSISANPNNVKFHAIQEAANTVAILPEDVTVITDTRTITVTVQVDFQTLFFGNLPYIRDWLSGGAFPIVARSAFPIAPTLYLEVTPPPIPTSTPTHTPTPTDTPTLTPTPPICFIDLVPSYGFAGTTFQVRGYQFAPGESVQIYWETELRNNGTVFGDGTFDLPVTVTAGQSPGDYLVTAETTSCTATAIFSIVATPTPTFTPTNTPTATPTFTPTPTPSTRYIIVNPGSGQPASTTTVYGYNFLSEQVTIEWPAVGQSSGPYAVNNTFVLTDTVPYADPGPYMVIARWGPADQYASDLFIIEEPPPPTPTATPSTRFIEVEPGSGQPGSTTTVYGYNFLPEEAVTIEWPDTITPTLWTLAGSANISGTFAIVDVTVPYPDDPPGPYSVIARWAMGDQYASDLFIIEEPPTPTPTYPYLILSPDSGAVSTPFAIEGHNLYTQTLYSLYWEINSFATVTTDADGNFTGITYTVPVSPPGIYTVMAQDGITATAPFEVIAHGAIAGTTYVSEDGSWPGEPTAGVTVAAYQGGALVKETVSVSGGYYILDELLPGTYYVVATYQIYWAASSVTVTSGTTTGRNLYLF